MTFLKEDGKHSGMEILLDKKRVIGHRKAKKMTQIQVAAKLGMSTRTYSDYENLATETKLSSLEMHKLANALGVSVYAIWGEIPEDGRATCYYKPTRRYSNFAKFIAQGQFAQLSVNGLPSEKSHRDPLLELIEVHEREISPEADADPKLSTFLRERFKCEDIIEQLADEIATDNPAKFMVMVKPILKVEQVDFDDDRGKLFGFNWSLQILGKIDFDDTDPEKVPHYYTFVRGRDSHILCPDFWTDVDPNRAQYEQEALEARGEIDMPEEMLKDAVAVDQNLDKEKDDEM
ncbi:helix-turn-helix domain-containing protein [Planktomarina temperata]|nr:helix-turn-helix domain-containing protein [Planktomarina temperata]